MSSEKKPSLQVSEKAVDVEGEMQSRTSSEAPENPFSDGNEASSGSHAAETVERCGQARESTQEGERLSTTKSAPLPSYSPLVFANYPPVWAGSPRPRPNPQATQSSLNTSRRSQSGFSAETLSAVMSAGSKDDKGKRFKEKDPSNRHQYLQGPERSSSSHARLNIFGRDIGGLGKHPSMGFRRQKGSK